MFGRKPKPRPLTIATLVLAAMLAHALSSCEKEAVNRDAQQEEQALAAAAKANSGGAETRTSIFGPIAATYGCLGYNVNFNPAQPVTLLETTTTDATGTVHYTRHWSVADLTARATLPGGAAYMEGGVPVTFVVISGQEMFSIKNPNTTTGVPSAAASGEVFIHQGTIVLENTRTGERVVIRHVIIKNPGRGIIKDAWYVNGQACS
jgi:hypothetical protein